MKSTNFAMFFSVKGRQASDLLRREVDSCSLPATLPPLEPLDLRLHPTHARPTSTYYDEYVGVGYECKSGPLTFNNAVNFLKEIKHRYPLSQTNVYDQFVDILRTYYTEATRIFGNDLVRDSESFKTLEKNTYVKMKILLIGNEDLLPALKQFLSNEIKDPPRKEDISYERCRQVQTSYCAYPDNNVRVKCSGRRSGSRRLSALHKEVLNDDLLSYSKTKISGGFINRRTMSPSEIKANQIEDERYELDHILEMTRLTIAVLDVVVKKMSKMSDIEAKTFKLDDRFGGTSRTIHKNTIERLYGEKCQPILDLVKARPCIGVPIVLKRLKEKDAEWRQAQKEFNEIWRNELDPTTEDEDQSILSQNSQAHTINGRTAAGPGPIPIPNPK